jgi:hypothetical protein
LDGDWIRLLRSLLLYAEPLEENQRDQGQIYSRKEVHALEFLKVSGSKVAGSQ